MSSTPEASPRRSSDPPSVPGVRPDTGSAPVHPPMTRILRKRSPVTSPLSLPLSLFATTGRGLEELLCREIAMLAPDGNPVATRGGVSFTADLQTLCRGILWLRTANRVLIRLGSFPAPDPDRLYEGSRTIPWHDLIPPDATIAVSATLRGDGITHSRFASLRVKDAVVDTIRDHTGRRPSVNSDDPDVPIHLHIDGGEGTLYLDPSGVSLDHRGYRQERGEAPLREHLAAALVLFSGWGGEVPLYDPFCGSGTILIEGAMIASRVPPGLLRPPPALLRWPWFPRSEWERTLAEGKSGIIPCRVPLVGSDADQRVIARAERTVARLPFPTTIRLTQRPFEHFSPDEGKGVIITNPPYGKRLSGDEDLPPLYRRVGDILKRRCAGSQAFVLVPHGPLAKGIGLRPSRRIPLFNGAIDCRLLCFDLFEGSHLR